MSIKFAKLSNGTWGVRAYNEAGTREPGQTVSVTKSDGTQVEKVLFELVLRDGPTELWSTTDARPVFATRSYRGRRPAPAPVDITPPELSGELALRYGPMSAIEPAEPVPTFIAEPAEPAPAEADGGFARLLAKPIRDYNTAVRLGVRPGVGS